MAVKRSWSRRGRLVHVLVPTSVPTAGRSAWGSRVWGDRLVWLSAVALLAVCAGGCGGNPVARFQPPKGYQVVEVGAATVVLTDAEVALRQAVEATAALEIEDTPLDVVVQQISQEHGIRIALDSSIIDDLGPDTPITFHASGISLRAALKAMLEELDSTYWFENESLVIGTSDAAEDHMMQRVYYVRDLIEGVYAPGATPTQALLGWSAVQTAGGLKSSRNSGYDALMEVMRETIEPDSWDDVGGPGSMEPFAQRYCLVISQTNDVHDRIEDLFRRLRTIPRH